MERHKSALKAARQSLKRRAANQSARTALRTEVKRVREAVSKKLTTKVEAEKFVMPLLAKAQKVLMKAASKDLIKKNTASRYVSRLSTAVDKYLSSHK